MFVGMLAWPFILLFDFMVAHEIVIFKQLVELLLNLKTQIILCIKLRKNWLK
ncbi:unnamed protein product [Brugia pahangi]|uniref:Uncharacterized protein n=1 Tax=Brugia pahangi TaxID=6280 RepID=A0A0N4TDL4_BRUPA|nr:unnamed protein product [Brugia pahangi]